MCTNDCASCRTPCPLSKFAAKLTDKSKDTDKGKSTTEEQVKMEQSTLNCHSTGDEKIVSHGERLNAITTGGKYCFLCLIMGIALMIWGVLYLNGKINDAQLKSAEEITRIKTEYSIRLENVEKACEDLKKDCEQARRDYTNARVTLHRKKQ